MRASESPGGESQGAAAATTLGEAGGPRTVLVRTNPRLLPGAGEPVTAASEPLPVLGPLGLPSELPCPWGRFAVIELLGRGGMGRVYRAHDPTLERYVALKVLVGDDPVHAERFQREARAQAGIDHPAVCKVFEVGDVSGVPYIAMQLVRGRTLDRAAVGLSLPQRVALVRQAAEGVHAAHRAGLIHRDLKPANVLVEEVEGGGRLPYVVDFGLARLLHEPGLTHTWQVAGTPSYMAPEQAAGRTAEADRRADVYGLGATLYEVLTGRPPFSGAHAAEVMSRVIHDDPTPPRALDPEIPRDLETIVLRCLDKEPDRRYQTAHELAEELGRFLDGEPIRSRRSGLLYRLRKRARKHRLAAAALGVAALAVLVTAAVVARAGWYARQEARLAGELGREVEAIEAGIRFVMMLPRHDVSADLMAARARIADLAARLPGLGRPAYGPGQYALGRGYLALAEHELALGHLGRAWDAGFRNPQVAYALGVVWGRLYEAQLTAAHRIPNPVLREQRLAEVSQAYRQPAVRFLSESRAAVGTAPELLEARLKSYEKHFDEALELCRAAAARLPWLYEAPLLESEVHAQRFEAERAAGRWEQAEAELDRTREALGRAEAVARSAPDVFEGYCRERYLRLALAWEAGRDVETAYPAVAETCEDALEVLPDNDTTHSLIASASWIAAEYLVARGRDPRPAIEGSLAHARRALAIRPSNYRHHNTVGLACTTLGEYRRRHGEDPRQAYAEARRAFEAALAVEPNAYYPLNNVALGHLLTGGWERARGLDPTSSLTLAVDGFDRAIAVNPRVPLAYGNQGSALTELAAHTVDSGGDPRPLLARATRTLQQATRLNARDRRAFNNLGWGALLAADYVTTRDGDPVPHLLRAAASFRQAIAINPDHTLAFNNLGETLWRHAEHVVGRVGADPESLIAQATASFEKVLAIDPSHAEARWGLGNLHKTVATRALIQGRPVDAPVAAGLRVLDEAIHLQPDLAGAHLVRGRLLMLRARDRLARGADPGPDLAAARAALLHSVELNPRNATPLADLGVLAILHARAALRSGGAAGAHLDEAVRWFDKARQVSSGETAALLGPVSVARWRAEAALAAGSDPGPDLAVGRAALAMVRGQRPENPECEALDGALTLVAARVATGAAGAEEARRAAAALRMAVGRWPELALDYAEALRGAEARR